MGAAEGLAQADEALIRVQPHPEDIVQMRQLDGFDGGDFHDLLKSCL